MTNADLRLYRARRGSASLNLGEGAPTPNDRPQLDFHQERRPNGNLEFAGDQSGGQLRLEGQWRSRNSEGQARLVVSITVREQGHWQSQSPPSEAAFSSELVVTGRVRGPSPAGQARLIGELLIEARLSGQADPVLPQLAAEFDINVFRGPSHRAATQWRPRGDQQDPHQGIAWLPQATRVRAGRGDSWQEAGGLEQAIAAPYAPLPRHEDRPASRWQEAAALAGQVGHPQRDLPRFWYRHDSRWVEALALPTFRASGFRYPPKLHRHQREIWQEAADLHRRHDERYRLGQELVHYLLSYWQEAGYPGPGRSTPPQPWVPPVPPRPAGNPNLNFWYPRLPGGDLEFVLRLLDVQPRRVYLVINNLTMARVDDGRQLHPVSVNISADTDSWAWTLSATLAQQDALDIVGGSFNQPVEVEVTINGYPLRFIIDRWRDDRAFNSYTITLGGMSKTGLLASRYSLPGSHIETNPRSAVQLVEQALPVGWSSSWSLEDWLVPAGAFSYANQTPMEVINRIAASAGGFVLSDLVDPTVHVRPIYKKAPWQLTLDDIDVSLPIDQFVTLGRELVESEAPNAVFVHGEQGGLLGRVYLDGSAGDRYAEMVVDSLMTDPIALRQRGVYELARQARYQRHSLQTVLAPDLGGLILPGHILEVRHPASHIGFVKGVSIAGQLINNALVVNQNITLDYPL